MVDAKKQIELLTESEMPKIEMNPNFEVISVTTSTKNYGTFSQSLFICKYLTRCQGSFLIRTILLKKKIERSHSVSSVKMNSYIKRLYQQNGTIAYPIYSQSFMKIIF